MSKQDKTNDKKSKDAQTVDKKTDVKERKDTKKVEKQIIQPIKAVHTVAENPFVKEFREFINRGSIVDLAIGVAVGGAFTAIVNSLVNDMIMPITSLILGGVDFSTLAIDIPNIFGADTTAHIAYGNFIQNVVNFIVVAFTVFLLVRMINRLNATAKERLVLAKKDADRAKEEATQAQASKMLQK